MKMINNNAMAFYVSVLFIVGVCGWCCYDWARHVWLPGREISPSLHVDFSSALEELSGTTSTFGFVKEEEEDNEVLLPRGLVVVNERYVLESPIQGPFLLQSPNSQLLLVPWQNNQQQDSKTTPLNENFVLDNRLARGGCGEVWFARDTRDRSRRYVLKRIFPEKLLSGLREVYFGERLGGDPRMSRFVEAFNRTTTVTGETELWLVFEDEGISLKSFLYESRPDGMVEPSAFWRKLRGSGVKGQAMRREIARQLVYGLHSLGQRNIVHRDIKPGNIFIAVEGDPTKTRAPVKIGDFGSAIDLFSFQNQLFGPSGPTRDDHTALYEPPEFFAVPRDESFSMSVFTAAFDAWSLGVLLLELLLGTDQVFSLSEHSKRRARRKGTNKQQLASSRLTNEYEERLLEFGVEDIDKFKQSVRELDPFGQGFADNAEVDFVFSLLRLDPAARLSFEDALVHSYFTGQSSKGLDDERFPRHTEAIQMMDMDETVQEEGSVMTSSMMQGVSTIDSADLSPKETSVMMEFVCGNCGRKFHSYEMCDAHARARRHYASSSRLDPVHPERSTCARSPSSMARLSSSALCSAYTVIHSSGSSTKDEDSSLIWCGNAGKKTYSEDFFAANEQGDAWMVLDGHLGETAARFAAQYLLSDFDAALNNSETLSDIATTNKVLTNVFHNVNEKFIEQNPTDESGAALTVVKLLPNRTIIAANVGDVRAFVCCDKSFRPVVLTYDHLASDAAERDRVESIPGGFVSFENGRQRLQGKLALTRAIGDVPFMPYISDHPFAQVFNASDSALYRFVIIGTDGVFDSMSNEDVVAVVWAEMVKAEGLVVPSQTKKTAEDDADGNENQEEFNSKPWWTKAAMRIVHESKARDLTTDNLGVAVIPLLKYSMSSSPPLQQQCKHP